MNGWISPLLLKCFLILLGDNLEKKEFFKALPQLVSPSFTRIWPPHRTGGADTLGGCTSTHPYPGHSTAEAAIQEPYSFRRLEFANILNSEAPGS